MTGIQVVALIRSTFVASLFVLALAGCAGTKVVEWTEDARLADGRIITVKRTEEFTRSTDVGAGFQSGWLFSRSTISARLPAPADREINWQGSLVPMLIDILPDGTPLLVGFTQTGAARSDWNIPTQKPPYAAFKMEKDWKRIGVEDYPSGYVANLLGATYELFITGDGRSGTHVDLRRKQAINSNTRIGKQAREIVR